MENILDIIAENERLIYSIIGKYKNYFELEDLYQVAVMGIIKAYKNYKSNYNTKFTSYAYPYILGEVIKYVNEYRCVKVSKNTKELYIKILHAKEVLAQKLMKEPSIYELSIFLEIDEKIIEDVIIANTTVDSLDKIIEGEDKSFDAYSKIGYYDENIENYFLSEELSKLTNEERQIIFGRYYDNMSQKEVGDALGMYQVEISRKEKKILKKLKDNIAA